MSTIQKTLLFTFLLISLNVFGGDNSTVKQMKDFFIETLKLNYGYDDDSKLILHFFKDYIDSDRNLPMLVDTTQLQIINKSVYEDCFYNNIYPTLIFTNSEQDFQYAVKQNFKDGVSGPKNYISHPSRYCVLLTREGYYNKFISQNTNIEPIKNIDQFYTSSGQLPFYVVANTFLSHPGSIKKSEVKEFISIVFWKYLCEQCGLAFYKYAKVTNEEINYEEQLLSSQFIGLKGDYEKAKSLGTYNRDSLQAIQTTILFKLNEIRGFNHHPNTSEKVELIKITNKEGHDRVTLKYNGSRLYSIFIKEIRPDNARPNTIEFFFNENNECFAIEKYNPKEKERITLCQFDDSIIILSRKKGKVKFVSKSAQHLFQEKVDNLNRIMKEFPEFDYSVGIF